MVEEIAYLKALIAEYERRMKFDTSPSLRASLRSLQKRLKIVEAEYAFGNDQGAGTAEASEK